MDTSEFDFNIAEGEFTDMSGVVLVYDESEYTVPAVVSKKYARKEVDGRYTTDLPLFTLSVTIAEQQMPSAIPADSYRLIEFHVNGNAYAVRYITGTGFLTFTLKPLDDGAEESDEIGDDSADEGSDDTEDTEDTEIGDEEVG